MLALNPNPTLGKELEANHRFSVLEVLEISPSFRPQV